MSQSINFFPSNYVPQDAATEVGRLQLIIKSAMSGLRTAMPVQVIAVTNNGDISPIGTLTVQPMVSAVDGSKKLWEHKPVYNVPYMRLQAGANGIIMDPQVGDIGIATVCDRDISTVKSTGKVSGPGSTRKNDMSDMVYLMTIIGAAPTQYIQFKGNQMTILSPNKITINAPDLELVGTLKHTGNVEITGNLTVDSNINATGSITGASISAT